MAEYRIRVKPMVPWPGSHTNSDTRMPNDLGKIEFIVGAPEEPAAWWNCGTDSVWPVMEIVFPDGSHGLPGIDAYVCRHQIQIGD